MKLMISVILVANISKVRKLGNILLCISECLGIAPAAEPACDRLSDLVCRECTDKLQTGKNVNKTSGGETSLTGIGQSEI